jgi:aminoglycoside phosphotransferase family enzyme/predicted kinase
MMELTQLIEALSHDRAYPHPVPGVEIRQTHISVVFLAGPYAYKIKKPVSLGFLDFTSLNKRRHFCEEEVRLNLRLAPAVYLGVVPVTGAGSKVQMEGQGEVVEWAVKMERLPEEATLLKRLQRGEVETELVEALARKIASFHARAEAGERIAAYGRFDAVCRNARENFEQSKPQVGHTLSQTVFERLAALTETALSRLRPLIEVRARRGVPRDTHGDLHLDHVYLFPDRQTPDDLVIIDCIEFNERFRFADPIADMAFLVMDLAFHGRRDLARAFTEAYFRASGDEEGRALLPFYTAYRAAIRGKVEGFELTEKEVPETERAAALARAKAHWLLALGELEEPGRRPCLVLVGGLPGTGKSTLARGLAERAGFTVIRSDTVRKELAGIPTEEPASNSYRQGIYTPEWTERTYAECLRRAERALFEGQRVLVDATFREERNRLVLLDAAARLRVPAVLLLCRAEPAVVRERLENRRGDASDADWAVFQQAAERWEGAGPLTRQALREVSTSDTSEQALVQALEMLGELGLHSRGHGDRIHECLTANRVRRKVDGSDK